MQDNQRPVSSQHSICLLAIVDVNEKHLVVIAALQNVLFGAGDFAGGDIYYLRMVFYGLL